MRGYDAIVRLVRNNSYVLICADCSSARAVYMLDSVLNGYKLAIIGDDTMQFFYIFYFFAQPYIFYAVTVSFEH